MANLELLEELGELIEDLTTSGSPSLKEDVMKKVKRICKSSEIYLKHAYHIVMTQLKKNHAEIRLASFQIINELFLRSHVFRELLLGDFQTLLELTVETDFKQPLPPPSNVAKTLMESAFRTVETWHQKYGEHYKKLDLGFKYLKRVKLVELDDVIATSAAERQRAEERERRKQLLLRKKLLQVENQMSETRPEMERCLTEMESCFTLLLPHPKEYEVHASRAGSVSLPTMELRGSIGKKITHNSCTNRTKKSNSKSSTAKVQCSGANSENLPTAEFKTSFANNAGKEGCPNRTHIIKPSMAGDGLSSDRKQMESYAVFSEENRDAASSESCCPFAGSEGKKAKGHATISECHAVDDASDECPTYSDNSESSDDQIESEEKLTQQDTPSEFDSDGGADIEERQQILTRHGLGTRSYHLSINVGTTNFRICETSDNSVILDKLRESNKEVTHKYLPMTTKWLSVLSKSDGMQLKIQEVIDLKRALEASRDKFLDLQIVPMEKQNKVKHLTNPSFNFVADDGSEDEESADDFEDVPEKEGLELLIPKEKRAEYGLEPLPPSSKEIPASGVIDPKQSQEKTNPEEGSPSSLQRHGATPHDLADPTSRARALEEMKRRLLPGPSATLTSGSFTPGTSAESELCQPSAMESDDRRQKLLQKAPVVPFDVDLYFWEDPTADVHKIVKSDFNNHWASKESEGEFVVEGEKGGMQKRTMSFTGTFEPVKWACRTPLPGGNLCPRRDRFKCPFHGKIVARDERGRPVDPENVPKQDVSLDVRVETQPDWKEVQRDIEAATGLDLGGKSARKRQKGISKKSEKLTQKQKYARLTDLKKNKHTSRTRLENIVLDPKAMRRVADDMHATATKKHLQKFGNQFNYAMHK